MSTQFTGQVAVIVPCHNYGKYLAECLDSIFAQFLVPREILVVDDSSTDNSKEVALRYAHRGVRYLRGDWKSVGAARNAGMNATTAPYLIFLDADDTISSNYVIEGLRLLDKEPECAIAYTDNQFFGNQSGKFCFPEPLNMRRFDTQNSMHAACMVRREALLQSGCWNHGKDTDGDWITWRRILRLGWKTAKSKGVLRYRMHNNNMTPGLRHRQSYAARSGLLGEPTTLCVALSGRHWAWPLVAGFLERQTYEHDLVHLILIDTSHDPEFGNMVRQWLARCDYRSYSYVTDTISRKGLADAPRSEVTKLVSHTLGRLYNRCAQLSSTALTLFLEDDMVPPDDAYPRIISHFGTEVLSVNAAYKSRKKNRSVGWLDAQGKEFSEQYPMGEGVSSVYGYGFGCSAIRTAYLKEHPFRSPEGLSYDFDFYDCAQKQRWKTLVDWNCICKHYQDADTWI